MKLYEVQILLNSGYYLNVLSAAPNAEEAKQSAMKVLTSGGCRAVDKYGSGQYDEESITLREVTLDYVPAPV